MSKPRMWKSKEQRSNMSQTATLRSPVEIPETPETPEKVIEHNYEIQGSPFRQTELTISEDIKMMRLFKESGGDETTMLESIANMENVEGMLRIVLKGDHTAIKFEDIKNSEMEQIMTDFFTLNNSMIKKFMSLGLYLQNTTGATTPPVAT